MHGKKTTITARLSIGKTKHRERKERNRKKRPDRERVEKKDSGGGNKEDKTTSNVICPPYYYVLLCKRLMGSGIQLSRCKRNFLTFARHVIGGNNSIPQLRK